MSDHGGTHIDAPRHFSVDGIPINEYPLENCIVKGICIDLRHIEPKAELDFIYVLSNFFDIFVVFKSSKHHKAK